MTPSSLRQQIKNMPELPGVYLIKGASGKPIYIGKARNLRGRLETHFGKIRAGDYKQNLIQRDARRIDCIRTASEAEALLLEASLIKEHRPPYNKELKDDKSYPFLKVTLEEEYPRLLVVRGRKSDGSVYFGPYTEVKLLRQAVSLLRRLFPLRTCQPMPKRVCLMYHIGQCNGPCEGTISRELYRSMVKELILFLEGKRDALVRQLAKRMRLASRERRYEEAGLFRDQMRALSAVAIAPASVQRSSVLDEMMRAFELSRYPGRIEAFDISNFTGKNPVGSVVVFEDAQPKRTAYRKFKIRSVAGIDDYEMMRELVRRRFERLLNEKRALPDTVLIDGGKGHLAAAKEELDRLNLNDLDLLSIAKQHEHVFKPERPGPFVLPLHSPVLQLVRSIRDEAHRFAIQFYRKLHRKEMAWSELNEIPGLGPKRKALLMRKFQSVAMIKQKGVEELAELKGIDLKTAKNITAYFGRQPKH